MTLSSESLGPREIGVNTAPDDYGRTRRYLTADELAGLPGMPGTSRGVTKRLSRVREEERRRRPGRGGAWEYAIDVLPEETQAALLAREHSEQRRSERAPGEAVDLDERRRWYDTEATSKQREAAERAAGAVRYWQQLVDRGIGKCRADSLVAEELAVPEGTLRVWRSKVKGYDGHDWPALLAPKWNPHRREADCSAAAFAEFERLYLRPEKPTFEHCYALLMEQAPRHGWTVPSLATLRRWIETRIPRPERVLLRQGRRAVMNLVPPVRRDPPSRAMEWVAADGYKHNVFVEFPDGSVGRPVTWSYTDAYSGKVLGWATGKVECADLIREATRHVVEQFGIPEHLTLDNTRAASSKVAAGGELGRRRNPFREGEDPGYLVSLGVQVHRTTVHYGRGNAKANRAERTHGVGGFGEFIDKRPEIAGAYTGPSPLAKPDNYGQRAAPWEVFLKARDEGIRLYNAKARRRAAMCGGELSYDQAFDLGYDPAQVRRPTRLQLCDLLLDSEWVRIGPDGSFELKAGRVHGKGANRYGGEALLEHAGQRCQAHFDRNRLHDPIPVIRDADGRLVAEDVACLAPHGYGNTEAAAEHGRRERTLVKKTKEAAAARRSLQEIDEGARTLSAALPGADGPRKSGKVQRGAFEQPRLRQRAAPPSDEINTREDAALDARIEGLEDILRSRLAPPDWDVAAEG